MKFHSCETEQNKLCKKACFVVHRIHPTGGGTTRAGRKDSVLLMAPSGPPCASKDEIKTLQLLPWLCLACWTGLAMPGSLWVCGLEGRNAAWWLLRVRGISLWCVTGFNKPVKPLTESLLALGPAWTKNSAMPRSYVALITRRLLMRESILILYVLQKWQLRNEEISTKALNFSSTPPSGSQFCVRGMGCPGSFGSMCSTASVLSQQEDTSASNREVKAVRKLFRQS